MKAWKKGAIVGGILGVIWGLMDFLLYNSIPQEGILPKIVVFPMYIYRYLIEIVQLHRIVFLIVMLLPFLVICTLLGTLIGSGIGYLIDKRKEDAGEG